MSRPARRAAVLSTTVGIVYWLMPTAPPVRLPIVPGGRRRRDPRMWSIEPVVPGLLGGEPAVPVAVPLDRLDVCPVCSAVSRCSSRLGVLQVLGLDLDVGRGAADAGRALVHQDPRVRQANRLPGVPAVSRNWPMLAARPIARVRHVVGDQAHRVVDRQAGADRAAGRVDVQADVGARVLGRQQQQLRAHPVGDRVVDLPSRAR